MRHLSPPTATALALALLTTTTTAYAKDEGFYIAGTAGLAIVEDADNGFVGGIAAGYQLSPIWRAELAVDYQQNDYSSDGLTGDIKVWSGFINGYATLPTDTLLKPYVGAGLGFAQLDFTIDSNAFFGTPKLNDKDTGFAYQGMLGVEADVDAGLKLGLGYTFRKFDKFNFNFAGIPVETDGDTHHVKLSLRYIF